jgi:uroporphyrinogen-III decarboxylase
VREESLTSEERIAAAINMEKPDRVPICPMIDTAPAANLLGSKGWEVVAQGFEAQVDLQLRLWDEYGGWDGVNAPLAPSEYALVGLEAKGPSSEIAPETQIIEKEVWTQDEYGDLVDLGWNQFVDQVLIDRVCADPQALRNNLGRFESEVFRFNDELIKRGGVPYANAALFHPFFALSMTRGMVNFTEDLFFRPDRVKSALDKIVPEFIENAIAMCRAQNTNIFETPEERAGGFLYPLDIFERLWWPYTVEIVESLHSEGIVTVLHLDACWDKNIAYFKQLPTGSVVLDLDGHTDIFAAREILGDRLCLGGDLEAALLCLGSPEEVSTYCKRLIDEVGANGGLLLNVGCSVPYAITPENFKAFLETGKTYELSN